MKYGKIPSTGGSEEIRTRDTASHRTASPIHYRLSYSGPPKRGSIPVSPAFETDTLPLGHRGGDRRGRYWKKTDIGRKQEEYTGRGQTDVGRKQEKYTGRRQVLEENKRKMLEEDRRGRHGEKRIVEEDRRQRYWKKKRQTSEKEKEDIGRRRKRKIMEEDRRGRHW